MPQRRPKSHKADGTPKKRWSAAERAARGRGPRKRGGRAKNEQQGRSPHSGRMPITDRKTQEQRPARHGERKSDADRKTQEQRPARHGGRKSNTDHKAQQQRPARRRFPPRADSGSKTDLMRWHHDAAPAVSVTGLNSGFVALGVDERIASVLASQGITEPFAIQRATISDALAGHDVLGRAPTGSGKTLAFGLAVLTRLAHKPRTRTPRAMIVCPSRELALQIAQDLAPLAAAVDLRLTLVAGGMSYAPQIRAFDGGVEVVVATPGRLIDLMQQGVADLSGVEIAVLDEADHMSDLGFLPEVKTLLDALAPRGQRLLFSATLDEEVAEIVARYLNHPVSHEVGSRRDAVAPMKHYLVEVAPHRKNATVAEIANREGRTIIFARTQMGSDRIAHQLRKAGILAGSLHGGLTQGARARVLAAFKEGAIPVLVATDVAARGIHVDDVSLVLQVDPPMNSKDYLHRAGRTARAGEPGVVVSVVLPHQRKMMRRITGQAGVACTNLDVTSGGDALGQITGSHTVSGPAIDDAHYEAIIAPKQSTGGSNGGYRRRRRHH